MDRPEFELALHILESGDRYHRERISDSFNRVRISSPSDQAIRNIPRKPGIMVALGCDDISTSSFTFEMRIVKVVVVGWCDSVM